MTDANDNGKFSDDKNMNTSYHECVYLLFVNQMFIYFVYVTQIFHPIGFVPKTLENVPKKKDIKKGPKIMMTFQLVLNHSWMTLPIETVDILIK